jgi:hypothetical protein
MQGNEETGGPSQAIFPFLPLGLVEMKKEPVGISFDFNPKLGGYIN